MDLNTRDDVIQPSNKVDVKDTSDYKLSKSGRKVKAHRIIFNKGEDDGTKQVKEDSMKKTYKDFVAEHAVETVDEELKGNQHKLDKNKNGNLDKHDFKLLRKEDAELDEGIFDSLKKGYTNGLKTGLKQKIKPEHHDSYNIDSVKSTSDATSILQKAKQAGHTHMKEESAFDWKNKPRQTSDSSKTKTYHDVKKVSTGTVYTKQFDKDGMSKGTGGDAAAKSEGQPKRGRGRPKKDKFAEAVEFLLALSEETFDDLMEEGFDAFIESYEKLDELSKDTIYSYAKKSEEDLYKKHKELGSQLRANKPAEANKTSAKISNRDKGLDRAENRLTK
jgi:hypothetical protein